MGWLNRAKADPLKMSLASRSALQAPADGLCFRLDQHALVLEQLCPNVALAHPLKQPATLHDYLTAECAKGLSQTPAEWAGQTLDLTFIGQQKNYQARVWLQPISEGWLLQGVWIDDLLGQHDRESQRRQLLSAAGAAAEHIRQAPEHLLHTACQAALATLAKSLGVRQLALAQQVAGAWQIYALIADPSARQPWWQDMALEPLGVDQARAGELLGASYIMAYPAVGGAQLQLLLGEPSTHAALHWLRDEDWPQLFAPLASALLQALKRHGDDQQQARMALLQELLDAGWWAFAQKEQRVQLAPNLAAHLALPAQMTLEAWLTCVHPADAHEFSVRLGQSLAEKAPFSHALRLGHSGNYRWYRLQANVQGRGERACLQGYLLDIDEVKQQQAQTAVAHARLSNLIAQAPAVIYLQDHQQGALELNFCSQSLEPLLGWNLSDLTGAALPAKVHPEDLDRFFARTRTLLQEGRSRTRYRLRDRHGHYHWLLDEANLLRDEQGLPQEVVGIWLDITEAVQADERIRVSEERYRVLVEDSPAMICRYRPDLTFTFVNKPLATFLERTPEALMGADFKQWLSYEQQQRFVERLQNMTPQAPVQTSEICVKLPACEYAWWVWAERGVFDDKGQLIEVQAVGRDNTEVRRTQQQLNQSAKMATLGEMATGMAHEMNQPLHVMRMAISNVLRCIETGVLEPHYLAEKLGRIEAQIQRAARIVDHIRVFGRQSAAETQLFDPQQCVYEAVNLLDESLKKHNIALTVTTGTEHVRVDGHADQLEQVLINLVVNARDALVSRRAQHQELAAQILIDTHVAQDRVSIVVQDNGGGIEPRLLERIFDPFFTTKEVGKGTGLGLSISYNIIQNMHGQLSVSNATNGACFRIELPCQKAVKAPKAKV